MEVPATIPIKVAGQTLCEFEAVLDVHVTYRGRPASLYGPPENCSPAEGPEWQMRTIWVDAGKWDTKAKRWKPLLLDCPDNLRPIIYEWAETRDGQDTISTYITEHQSEAA